MELGQTDNPKELIPGDPDRLTTLQTELNNYAQALELAARGLQRISTDGWTGAAADAFHTRYEGEPKNWLVAADSFTGAAHATGVFADTLIWAQTQASEAINDWNRASRATDQAKQQYGQTPDQGSFEDPGEILRAAARERLTEARMQLAAVGDESSATTKAATEPAPQTPGFWEGLGKALSDLGAKLQNTGGYLVNGLASLGNAMLHHPEAVAAILAGTGAATLGLDGELGGVALDATGAGAVAGVPINVASAGLIAAGATTAIAGAGVLMSQAAGDDAVHPASTDNIGSSADHYTPTDGFRGKTQFSQDEIEQFINGHTGDANITMDRPSMTNVHDALTKGTAQMIPGRNAEVWVYKNTKVVVNCDQPWRSSAWKLH